MIPDANVIHSSSRSRLLMRNQSVHSISEDSLSTEDVDIMKKWPWFFWFLLKFVGLFNSRQVVTKRQCHVCHMMDEGRMEIMAGNKENVTNDQESDSSKACLACRSEWWIAQDLCRPDYSESEIGARKWNHCGGTVLAIVWPLTLCLLSAYNIIFRLCTSMGTEEQKFRIINYATFKLLTVSIPALILTANVHHFVRDLHKSNRRFGFSWYSALNVRFIVANLQFLELGKYGLPRKPFLAVCLIWPFLTGLYSILYYFDIMDPRNKVSVFNDSVCMLVYGVFCYMMLLLRLSFQKRLPLELAFLRRHAGALDVCRRRVALYAEALTCVCKFVSKWLLFVIFVSTCAICTEINWDYKRLVNFSKIDGDVFIKAVNLLACSEYLMFLTLPILAIGGVGLNDMWAKFKRSISLMRSEEHEVFWDKILVFCKEQSPVCRVVTQALVFTALALFFELKFDDDVAESWPNIIQNTTGLDFKL